MKIFLRNKKSLLVFALGISVLINIIQLPFIIESAPKNWRSISLYDNPDIIESAISEKNSSDTFTSTHNIYMALGEYAPDSVLFVSEDLDAESESKIFGLSEVKNIKKRDINENALIQKIKNLTPSYSDVMWTSPGHRKSGGDGINWKIYIGKDTGEMIFIKSEDKQQWFIIDESVIKPKDLSRICDGC